MSEKITALGDKAVHAVKNNVTQMLALIYGIGMLTYTAFNQMNNTYWAFFLTDICGLPADVMGTVKLWAGFGEWIFVLVAAIVVERVWLRRGQYRSWILLAPPLAFIFILMTFVDPFFLDQTGKAIWMMFFLIVGYFFVSLFMISATSIVPVISKTERDRTLLSQRKAQGNMLVKVLFAMISLPMILAINQVVYSVPGENAQSAGAAGYTITAIVFGIIMIVMFAVMYKKIKGMDPTEEITEARYQAKKRGEKLDDATLENAPQKVGIVVMLKTWITNIPAVVSFVTETTRFIASMTIQGMAMYFFLYVYSDVAMVAIMLTAANIVGLIATFVSEPVARVIGLRNTYATGIAIAALSMFVGYFIGAHDQWVFVACICACYFGMNFMNGTMLGVQSNAIAYGEWRDGKVGKAFIMATYQWTPKIGNMFAGALYGFGLAALGYYKDMPASPDLAQGMINIICLIPACCFAVAFVLFIIFYRLSPKKMMEIESDLDDREQQKKREKETAAAALANNVS